MGMLPDDPSEFEAAASQQLPLPFFETHFALGRARAVMAATRLGVFEALGAGVATVAEIADRCETDTAATQQLLLALAGSGYLLYREGRYALTPSARTWLLADSPTSIVDVVLFAYDEWGLMAHVEDYVRTGIPLEMHQTMTGTQWAQYLRSMRALARLTAHEVADVLPIPDGATDMIDVGDARGHYSIALCRRYPRLRSLVLGTPKVGGPVPPAAAAELDDRIVHLEADALLHDFGAGRCDLVLLCDLGRHFSATENTQLFRRLGRTLRPRGVFAVIEPARLEKGHHTSQFAALNELYFGTLSHCQSRTPNDTAGLLRDAGLQPAAKPIMLSGGEVAVQIATKTSAR
ncbi:methyltransferase family protein [Mycobacterium sherrisii]|nr:methyltransferase [Mycobacterium sherrisii]MCV7028002.1 hypothetical protein [Mycobacterium sherrisii]MEC4765108.1 methyltransferase [Mycobacterium sherrisii]